MFRARPRPPALRLVVFLGGTVLAAACDDGASPQPLAESEVAVVVNSLEISVTVFPVDDTAAAVTVGLAPDGSPVGLSVRGELAAVPLGVVPALAVVDLGSAEVARTVALPPGSGATGSAFLDDTLVVVANPNLNSVSLVDVRAGVHLREVPVGGFPQGVVVVGGRVFVLNSELGPDFQPARTGTISVLAAADLTPLGLVELSGENPADAAPGPDGLLYVLNGGRFFGGDGSLSLVDPSSLEEVSHHVGFGEFPGALAFDAAGRLHVASFAYGLAVWAAGTRSFERSPEGAVTPGDVPSVSGLGFDSEGRLYTLLPDCQGPGKVLRLDPTFAVELSVQVGTCPIAISFATLEGS